MGNDQAKFILNTLTAWDEAPRSRHQVASELKNYGDVYFITRNNKGKSGVQLLKHDGINYIIPSWPIDYRLRYRLPVINELYQIFLRKALSQFNIFGGIFINFDHTAHLLVDKFKKSVYYCSDDHIANSSVNLGFINHYHIFTEKKVSTIVNLCIATSDYLYNKLSVYNPKTYLVPLGAPILPNEPEFHSSRASNNIKVCYVGFMEPRKTDKRIIQDIIDSKDMELVVIGKVDGNYKRIIGDKAVLTGLKKGSDLYDTIEKTDICIIPYKVSGINKGVTPNKYWLYTALGKPVVSVKIPNIENWPTDNGLLYLTSQENFAGVIKIAFEEDSIQKFNHRVLYSKQNTWGKRINDFVEVMQSNKLLQ